MARQITDANSEPEGHRLGLTSSTGPILQVQTHNFVKFVHIPSSFGFRPVSFPGSDKS